MKNKNVFDLLGTALFALSAVIVTSASLFLFGEPEPPK